MVVRAVEIDEAFADFFEESEGDGGVVDKLAVGGDTDGAAYDDLGVFAGREAAFFEDGVDFRRVFEVEDGFDGAGFLAGADEAFVGAFAEYHFQCADDDGFSGSGFAGDGDKAGAEFPCEFVNEGEITDFEEGEHWGNFKFQSLNFKEDEGANGGR